MSGLDVFNWRNWRIVGCVRDDDGVLRLILEDQSTARQHTVMAVEAPDWKPSVTIRKGQRR